MGNYNQKELNAVADTKTLIGDSVEHYREICGGEPAIAFCTSILHAEHTAEMFCNAGYKFKVLHGELDKKTRNDIIDELSTGKINGITSVNCVSEGTDIPVVSVAILMRPTLSLAMHLQQVGRALRTSPGKTRAVILDHSGNTHRHGMPDTPRQWSLDTKIVQGKKSAPVEQEAWRECPKCFGYIPILETQCPQCGAEYVKKEIEMIETVSGKLELVVEDNFHEKIKEAEKLNWLQSIGIENMTDTQIREYGKLKGYKPGWSWMKINQRKKKTA